MPSIVCLTTTLPTRAIGTALRVAGVTFRLTCTKRRTRSSSAPTFRGVSPDELEVNYQQGVLTLRATMKGVESQDGWRWYVREIGAGEVTRQITLPRGIDVDQASANFENGVLTLTLPKSATAKPRRITIGNGGSGESQHQITAQ